MAEKLLPLRGTAQWICALILFPLIGSTAAYGVLDLDGDGMGDLWQKYYGAENLVAGADSDGDGLTNEQESEMSSDPFNAESYFGLRDYEFDEDEAIASLTFHTAFGNRYIVESCADLPEFGDWRTEKTLRANSDGLVTLGCPVDLEVAGRCFFRVRQELDEDGDGLSSWEEFMLGLEDRDANSNGESSGGDMAWLMNKLYSSASIPLADGTTLQGSSPSMEEVSRFLNQATFGASYDDIVDFTLSGKTFGEWIDEQLAIPATTIEQSMADEMALGEPAGSQLFRKGWWRSVMTGDDQLRLRLAYALSQILVVSGHGSEFLRGDEAASSTYYDLLVDGAFGSYTDLLEDVTFNLGMGTYLGHLRNKKQTAGVFPDENYAREVMQLFSIGLWELNPDGSHRLDQNGQSIPTYTNHHIEELARVLTGFNWGGTASFIGYNYTPELPMVMYASAHDGLSKVLVNGGFVPAGQTPEQDVRDAIENLAEHPNAGPFIGLRLIQRFTTSNPSPGYIQRVANAYRDNGSGETGDLRAVIRAVILDPEARSPVGLTDPKHGKMREPYLTYVHAARAFDAVNTFGSHPVVTLFGETQLGQVPLSSPTVFNFYRPDFVPLGTEAAASGLVAPEFQILTPNILVEWPNLLRRAIRKGIDPWYLPADKVLAFDQSVELDLALNGNTEALIDRLDLVFTYGTLTDESRETIRAAVEDWALAHSEKAWIAIYLVMTSPEYNVLR